MTKSKHTIEFQDEQMFVLKQILKSQGKKSTVQAVVDYALNMTEQAHHLLDEETLQIIKSGD